jgi:ferric-dicitrate binding protein FerR (iron transport regulator)
VTRPSVLSEATKWLVRIQTSRSIDPFWPDFEAWLHQDEEHWTAFLQAQREWRGLDCLKSRAAPLHAAGKAKSDSRLPKEILWLALGTSLLTVLLLLS